MLTDTGPALIPLVPDAMVCDALIVALFSYIAPPATVLDIEFVVTPVILPYASTVIAGAKVVEP